VAVTKPWGPVDPNSTHQRWSDWTFRIHSPTRRPGPREVRDNARRFARAVFRSTVGQLRLRLDGQGTYEVRIRIEGPAVYDPGYRASVERTWFEKFVRPGFGPDATMTMTARHLAGSPQDGRPAAHLIVAPAIAIEAPAKIDG